jgi:hypothetical protein
MALTNAGRNFMAQSTVAAATTPFNAANAHIGVGDSTTAFDPTQTDLQAATNKLRHPVSGAPSGAANVIAFSASFATDEANFAWAEWGIFNAASSGTMLSRKVEALGTKTSGVWVLTAELTFTAA